ncbi:hypothetical protein MJO28_004125 [Puccinia striiformis f. sp. tritici]|uniref:EamA domain-containing protein n=2 Tax=Puccinia striiformis f. sp. tritici TaxID=168172 RepID=A0A0L0VPA9_9BASI|nr:hypothetical protein Pst134EA_007260 [Puccinia striiformis f. sp. tritici]KAH9469993.1 hypothetical protein Pst134EA_007260 [Puccinia striiformis f. sp. tritici]KAI7957030.1 hypothetical protein MJO28_004125 [Puccinia striiformis f. sp. tritici]KAI9617075.1 hypothetical protein H4Q26_010713 [Puccinia striiformis f. sp. tritici PST-130]KNF01096.1 hypothetical protein PSTG_05725 [Puccinia striiformis f. sp. tritici PST-78]
MSWPKRGTQTARGKSPEPGRGQVKPPGGPRGRPAQSEPSPPPTVSQQRHHSLERKTTNIKESIQRGLLSPYSKLVMANSASAAILVTGMLITGCSNSLWSKFQDQQCVENCTNPDPRTHRNFEQPVWQTLNMFVGEACCMIAYLMIQWISKRGGEISKDHGYVSIPRDSMDGGLQEEEELESTLGDTQPPDEPTSISDSLLQPAHLKSRVCPAPSPLAVLGPSAPLTSSLEPELLVNQHEPSILQLVGLQKLVFWLPALFDICGTTLMNAGLLFVPVSVFQMIRGALPIWVGLFSIIFLNRHLSREKWISLAIITSGVALVGYAGSLQSSPPDNQVQTDKIFANGSSSSSPEGGAKVLLGLFLIFFAQLFTASQFVIEEKIMSKYEVPPLEAVGLEGVFGLITTLVGIPLLHIFIGSTEEGRGGYFDARTGVTQVLNNPSIMWSSLAIAISIGLFNFCGLAVTKSISATARSVIDTCRSVGIWAFSLAIGWESFSYLQLAGFIILVIGTFFFNQIVLYPNWFKRLIGSAPLELRRAD